MKTSQEREELEKNANYEILGMNAIQQTSKFARRGDFEGARVNARAWDQRLASNINSEVQNDNFIQFRANIEGMYNEVTKQKGQSEPMNYGDQISQ